jgi:alkanesulfonate monooxygenase SsuD/methylene tetrahydromethanopterin reductase-like flavin-dependent oxidoreductase (luciferase family)
MKLNLFAMPTIPSTLDERLGERPIGRSSSRYQMMIDEVRQLAVVADRLGYDSFSTTEHHFHTEGGEVMPNPVLLFADLAARTEQITFTPFSIVIPAHNPLRVAEDLALLSQLSKGRVGVAFARGYQKRWIQVITQGGPVSNVDKESDAINREIFEEHIEIVLKAFGKDAFAHKGKHFEVPYPHDEGVTGWPAAEWTRTYGTDDEIDADGVIRKIGVIPPPYENRNPTIFVPLTLSPRTVDYAARHQFTGFVFSPEPQFREICEHYRRASRAHGFDLALGQRLGANRAISVARSREEAFEIAARSAGHSFQYYFGKFGFNEVFRTPADDPEQPVTFADEYACAQRLIDIGWCLCGTPDEVGGQVEDLRTLHGVGGDLEWLQWSFYQQGAVPLETQLRQVEMFAAEVWPEFAQRPPSPADRP